MLNQKSIKGEFWWEIIDKETGSIIQTAPLKRNLILNQGLDFLAVRSFVSNVAYCALGTSTTAPLLTDTGLASEVLRTNTLDISIPNYAVTALNGNVYSFTRVFKFSNVSYTTAYGEIGWSYSGTTGNNLFSKAQIMDTAGTPRAIRLPNSTYLRVYYTISVTLSPSTSIAGPNNIDGLSAVTGVSQIQLIGLKKLNSDGSIGNWDVGTDCNELYSTVDTFVSRSSTALAAFGSSVDRSGSTNYTNSSFSNTYIGNGVVWKSGTFGKTNANDTSLRSMGLGSVGSSTTNSGFVFVFDSSVTKDVNHLLTTTFIYSVVRL